VNHFQDMPRLSRDVTNSFGIMEPGTGLDGSGTIVVFGYLLSRATRAASTRSTKVLELKAKSGPRSAALVAQKLSSGTLERRGEGESRSNPEFWSSNDPPDPVASSGPLLELLNVVSQGLGGKLDGLRSGNSKSGNGCALLRFVVDDTGDFRPVFKHYEYC
jgi:hypothetical protein